MKKRLFGFTLAEVLITLGIIGTVCAMTIPILMNNIQDAQFKTAYKKAYSVASQALNQANADYLMVEFTNDASGNNFKMFMQQFKVAKECFDSNNSECWDASGEKMWQSSLSDYAPKETYSAFIDSSGMAWSTVYTFGRLLVDTNGFKSPNQWGKDRFVFSIYDINDNNSALPLKIKPYSGDYCLGSSCDNTAWTHLCQSNKCGTDKNYYGTSWLYN